MMKHTSQTIAHAYASAFARPNEAGSLASVVQACIAAGVLPVIVDETGKRKRCFLDQRGFLQASLLLLLKDSGFPVKEMKTLAERFDTIPLHAENDALLSENGMKFVVDDNQQTNTPARSIYLIIEKENYALSMRSDYREADSLAVMIVEVAELYRRVAFHDFKNRCFVRDMQR